MPASSNNMLMQIFNFLGRCAARLTRVFYASGGVDCKALEPGAELEALSGSGTSWRSTGRDPYFTISVAISPGWLRVASWLDADRSALAQIFWDTGDGFNDAESAFLADLYGKRGTVKYIRVRRPIWKLRFDPTDVPMDFKVLEFSAVPLADIRMWIEALRWKFDDMRSRRNFSRSLKYGLKLLLKFNLREFRQKLFPPDASVPQREYEAWCARNRITAEKHAAMLAQLATWPHPPKISVLVPVYNVPEIYLRKALDSVLNQIYPHWELCVADDKSNASHIRPLLEEYAQKDTRIKVVFREQNGHISAASNSALELATGEFVATLDNDDELTEHALFEVAKAIVADPLLDFIYSDEDKIDLQERRIDPFFKPDWSPEYFLACMYTCHLGVYRTSLLREIGGFRSAFDTAQDYDLVLRVIEKTRRIHHIPDVLYHWRMLPTSTASGSGAKPKAHGVAQAALRDHLQRTGARGTVEDGPSAGFHRVRYAIVGNPKISILIPSTCATQRIAGKDVNYLDCCLNSILTKSTWRNIEIIILDRNQMPTAVEARYAGLGIRRMSYSEPFNWSRVNNLGAAKATGEYLLFLNDDMEVITPDWLESMLEFAQRDGVGAVGAKLLFPDDRIQHTGIAVLKGGPGHSYRCFPKEDPGYFFSNSVHRNWLAVTGACLMTPKAVFDSVGGFNEDFPLNYNDVDYCMKLVASGRRIVYTPYAQLYHFESASRPRGVEPDEVKRFQRLWLEGLPYDPYCNPNLTVENGAFAIAKLYAEEDPHK